MTRVGRKGLKHEKPYCTIADSSYSLLSACHLASFARGLPIYAHLQPICYRGVEEVWGGEGEFARGEADMPLPSLGRQRV